MSHLVLKLYSFECDVAGCNGTVDALPPADARRPLDDARKQIARVPDRWSLVDGKDICDKQDPAHEAARGGTATHA